MAKKPTRSKTLSSKTSKFKQKESGIFRSQLEVYCAWKLQEAGISYLYEPASYVVFEDCITPFESLEKTGKKFRKVSNKVRKIKYTPDFVGDDWIIETKGMRTEAFNMRWKLFKKYLVDNNLYYDLYVPSNRKEVDLVIEDILIKKGYEPHFKL